MRKRMFRMFAVLTAMILLFQAGCNSPAKSVYTAKEDYDDKLYYAMTTPYGAYPETISYTLGKMTSVNNSNMPEGDTYTDNAYTRYIKNMINVQNIDAFEAQDTQYNTNVSMAVSMGALPDIMMVSSQDDLQRLVEADMIEDLTESYNNCLSSRIRAIYNSYGSSLKDMITFDGRIMALPETNITDGPNLIWLRKDWMDKLGLEDPKTLEDAFDIVEKFVQNKMGTEDGEDPIGLACDTDLVGTTSSNYSVDSVFDKFGASPQRWVNQNGKIVYGSVTEETKNALSYLHELYERGVLDKNFALRAQNNLRDLVINGKCGAFFGLWWTPNNPLMDVYETDKEANWQPFYLQSTDWQNVYDTFQDNKYVVVRKGYEHPEIVMKIISVLFDYSRYEAKDADEVNDYFALNVEPTARPLVINVDYNEATFQITKDIQSVMSGMRKEESLSAIEKSYYDAAEKFIQGKSETAEDWAAYESRLAAVGRLIEGNYRSTAKRYLDDADGEIPKSLQQLEKDTFIQIIMGVKPITYFDTFVQEWYEQGGEELTEQIRRSNPGE